MTISIWLLNGAQFCATYLQISRGLSVINMGNIECTNTTHMPHIWPYLHVTIQLVEELYLSIRSMALLFSWKKR